MDSADSGFGVVSVGHAKYRRNKDDEVKTYPKDRICAFPGCDMRLSVYNPLTVCAIHTHLGDVKKPIVPKRPPKWEKISRVCANPECGRAFLATNPVRIYCSKACRMRGFQLAHPSKERKLRLSDSAKTRPKPAPKATQRTKEVLSLLGKSPDQKFVITEVAKRLDCYRESIYHVFDKLVKKGWLVKEFEKNRTLPGRPALVFRLTDKGKKEITRVL